MRQGAQPMAFKNGIGKMRLTKEELNELLARYKEGDKYASDILVQQVTALIYFFSKIFRCPDAVFLVGKRVHSIIDEFDPSRGNLSTWVKWKVLSVVSGTNRKKTTIEYVDNPYVYEQNSHAPPSYKYAEDVRRVMWQCMQELPERIAQMTIDRYLHGMKLREIAEKFGVSSSLVSIYTLKALSTLRIAMEEEEKGTPPK